MQVNAASDCAVFDDPLVKWRSRHMRSFGTKREAIHAGLAFQKVLNIQILDDHAGRDHDSRSQTG